MYELCEITTKDGIVLSGVYHEPEKKGKYAILWVHGLTSRFYSDSLIFSMLINHDYTRASGVGFASFNTRGHESITGLRKVDKRSSSGFIHVNGGAGYETFEECIHDIDAGISFLIAKGYAKVFVVGHSTGALKAGYYAAMRKDARVAGIVAAAPMSDRLIEVKTNPKLALNLRRMKHMIGKGKGDFLVNNLTFFPLTPRRYVSLFDKDSVEQTVFDYGSEKPRLTYFQKIKAPLLVVLSECDEYADRPIGEIKTFFDAHQKSQNYTCAVIPNAVHGYEGQEGKFVELVLDWIKELTR